MGTDKHTRYIQEPQEVKAFKYHCVSLRGNGRRTRSFNCRERPRRRRNSGRRV